MTSKELYQQLGNVVPELIEAAAPGEKVKK